jgi:hypothetical protein
MPLHDEVELADMEYDATFDAFVYPCPCGDEFTIAVVCVVSLFM